MIKTEPEGGIKVLSYEASNRVRQCVGIGALEGVLDAIGSAHHGVDAIGIKVKLKLGVENVRVFNVVGIEVACGICGAILVLAVGGLKVPIVNDSGH